MELLKRKVRQTSMKFRGERRFAGYICDPLCIGRVGDMRLHESSKNTDIHRGEKRLKAGFWSSPMLRDWARMRNQQWRLRISGRFKMRKIKQMCHKNDTMKVFKKE